MQEMNFLTWYFLIFHLPTIIDKNTILNSQVNTACCRLAIMMGSYNARLIYPIGYSRRRCGATAALIRQPQTHLHNEEPEIRNRILWEGVRFLGVGGNRSARRKPTKAGMESANQIHIQPLASCIGERKVYEH